VPIRGRVPVARRACVERVIVLPAAVQDGLVRLALACGVGIQHRHSVQSNSTKGALSQAMEIRARGIEFCSVMPRTEYMALTDAAMKCYVTE
jgi:hypothetical protein